MKKNALFLLILVTFSLFGQFHPLENYPTPNMSGLGDFGKVPVNMYSGVPVISIPLYELKEADLSLPINLNYSLASVKPNNYPSWVGLGWSLSAGGYITRNVRGVYDEKKTETNAVGFYSHYAKLQTVNDAAGLGRYGDNYCEENNAEPFELMPDEYNFNFGTYSGRFYLSERGEWVVVSDDEIKVEFEASTGFRSLKQLRKEIVTQKWANKNNNQRFFDKFTLITPDGVKYVFGGQYATEYSINYYNRNNSDLIPTTWYLSEIQSPNGRSITLEYEAGSPICDIKFAAYSAFKYQDLKEQGGGFLAPKYETNYINNGAGYRKLNGFLMFPVYLKRINTSYVTVEFYSTDMFTERETLFWEGFLGWEHSVPSQTPYNEGLYDSKDQFGVFMPSNYSGHICELQEHLKWRTLKGITINNLFNECLTRTFYLEYKRENRKKLTAISEQIGVYCPDSTYISGGWRDCVSGVEYMGRFLQLTTPYPKDYLPRKYQFTYNESKTYPRYVFASTDHWGYYNGYSEASKEGERSFSIPYTFDENFYNSRNATYNLDIAQAETLKEIIYPTGGKTHFSYQQNRYTKTVSPNRSDGLLEYTGIGGGLCVSEIINYDEDGQLQEIKRYYYTDEIPSTSGSGYTSSGILNAKKEYAMYYGFENGFYAIASEGGFNTTGTNQSDPYVGYSSVIEETLDREKNSMGFVRYRYTSFDKDLWGEKHADQNYHYAYNISGYTYASPVSSRSLERGKLLSEEYFNKDKQLIKKKQYKYARINEDSIKMPWQEVITVSPDPHRKYAYFSFMNYVYTHRYLVSEKIETEYDLANQSVLTNKQIYAYNKQKLLTTSETTQSNRDKYITEYKYPMDFSSTAPYDLMVDRNIISPVIEQTVKKNGVPIKSELLEYKLWNGRTFAPQYIKHWNKGNSNMETRMTFLDYNYWGNPLMFSENEAEVTTILWEYDKQYPVIEIKNKTMEEIESKLTGEALGLFYDTQFSEPMTEEEIITLGKLLREQLTDALVTTYTYTPSVGMTSMTNPRGVTTYYEYDSFGRLKETYIMEDGKKKVSQAYHYHYSNR